jgi:hypothetical protein
MPEKRAQPDYCFDVNCPLAGKSRGFALGCGDPSTAKLAILFERPAESEIGFFLTDPLPPTVPQDTRMRIETWRKAEIERRHLAFPALEDRFILKGAPVRGASGAELEGLVFPQVGGLKLDDCFLENTLHCASPDDDHLYPHGVEKEVAEACCAYWNRLVQIETPWEREVFVPEAVVASLHPAGLLKEKGGGIVALPLQIDTFKKAMSFVKQEGMKVLVLAGGKAVKWWLGYGESVTRWCGHYAAEDGETWSSRIARQVKGMELVPMAGNSSGNSTSDTNPTILRRRKKPSKPPVQPIPGMEVLNQ